MNICIANPISAVPIQSNLIGRIRSRLMNYWQNCLESFDRAAAIENRLQEAKDQAFIKSAYYRFF